MPASNPAPRRADPIARHARPLPAAPSIEYERKEAKALLRLVRTGDAAALARFQAAHPVSLRGRTSGDLKLADAQHVIAREYGFTSWPRLVAYLAELERQKAGPRHNSPDSEVEQFELQAKGVMRRQERGDPIVAREIAHFVPRFYARPASEVLATPVTPDEARLVVARQHRRASWAELVSSASACRAWQQERVREGNDTPLARARQAIRAHDADTLAAIFDEHPGLLEPTPVEREWRATLIRMAVSIECDRRTADARRITDLLASRGADVQRELDERLLGSPFDAREPERVRWYLERGANPAWMPANGITVLEHALVRFRDAACVDLIARRVTPPHALWVAAGLGDVDGVRGFVAGKGRLTAAGRRNRPDLIAMDVLGALPPAHDADDLEIMGEAFRIAGWNGRWAAMDALLEAGLPVDHSTFGWPPLVEAVGNLLVPLAGYLVSRGADLDREWPSGSARSLAREHVKGNPESETARQMLAICCAGTPDEILARLDAERQSPPPLEARTVRALQLAADDAHRQEQQVVTTGNLLVGFLRVSDGIFAHLFLGVGSAWPSLRSLIAARLLPDRDPLLGQELGRDAGAVAAIRAATAEADARRREWVDPTHLLWGIMDQRDEPGAALVAEAGMSETWIRKWLEGSL